MERAAAASINTSTTRTGTIPQDSQELIDYTRKLIISFSPIFTKRFDSQSKVGGKYKPVEEAEEIRLLLVQIMAVLVQILDSDSDSEIEAIEEMGEGVDAAVASVCQSISKNALVDAYPELKRETCHLIKAICSVFPGCIRMHAESLLTPIVGTSISRPRDDQIGSLNSNGLQSMEMQFSSFDLSTSTNSLMRHRHAKTRLLALDTVTAILSSGCYLPAENEQRINGATMDRILLQVLPNVEAVSPFDKSASVRIALAKMVCSLIGLIPITKDVRGDSYCHERNTDTNAAFARLLVLHLMCVSDESESVKDVAEQELSNIANMHNGTIDSLSCCEPPCLISTFAAQVLEYLILYTKQSTSVEQKKKYLDAMCSAINCLNRATASALVRYEVIGAITSLLIDSFSSNEKVIFQSTRNCAAALGNTHGTRSDAMVMALEAMSDNTQDSMIEEVTAAPIMDRKVSLMMSTSPHCTSLLRFVSSLLKNITPSPDSRGLNHGELIEIENVMSTVSGRKVIDFVHVSQETAFALLDLLRVVVECIHWARNVDQSSSLDSSIRNSLFCCIHLLGCNADFGVSPPVKELMKSLDRENQGSALDTHFKHVLKMIFSDLNPCWEFGDPGMHAFDALLRNASANCIGDNFNQVGLILDAHLCGELPSSEDKGQRYFQKKLFFMALLESVVSKQSVSEQHLNHFVESLVRNAIIPNLVWQSGALASSLRKVAVAVLFSLVRGGGLSDVALFKCAPVLLPTLKSTTSDDDSSTRELATATLAKVLEKIPGVLGVEAVQHIYPDLMKLLDDSNERVRLASCDALKHFLSSAPPKNFQGAAIEYMVENLFLHLDDPSPLFREKVYNVLCYALVVDPNTVASNAKNSLSSHRDKELCLKLLDAATNAVTKNTH